MNSAFSNPCATISSNELYIFKTAEAANVHCLGLSYTPKYCKERNELYAQVYVHFFFWV